ncbi:MAG: hypothetical protein MRJ92_12925 [Nitrospira sp.]|nr:hypothetical protein [Nitrospira sp.]
MLYKPLNLSAMMDAAACLIGRQDFSSLKTAPTDNDNPQCHMQQAELRRQGDLIARAFYADRFLKQMFARSRVRWSRWARQRSAADMPRMLAARACAAAGRTAPAHGLYLVRVDYQDTPTPIPT